MLATSARGSARGKIGGAEEKIGGAEEGRARKQSFDAFRRSFDLGGETDPRSHHSVDGRLIDGGLQAASRAATLVQRLLAFARRQDLQPRPVAIPALLEGMSDTLARAVEPFFSTRGQGKGTGLGLSMVHGLAAQLGGMLSLTSAPGQGTTAEILLPTTTEQPGKTDHDSVVLQEAVVRATILLVDDEELVRNGTADMLRDIGYDVLTAASGAEALMLLRSGCEINLLVTDYLMPGMNGVDLVQAAGSLVPGLPALLITGYSNIASGPGAALPRLAKPYRQVDLAARVAELLVQRAADVVPIGTAKRNQP